MSYHGPFDLYEDRIVHHIEMSTDPGLIGRDNIRLPVAGWGYAYALRPAQLDRRRSEWMRILCGVGRSVPSALPTPR